MADGFLGRWSRRKEAAREGKALPEPVPAVPASPAIAAPPPVAPQAPAPPPAPEVQAPPPPSLEDVQALTPQSDFSRFVRPDVAPQVRNAALKKLFADPHFNVMDGLDIYIDDYTRPDPIPPAMLRSLASSKFLGLFDEEQEQRAGAREAADAAPAQSVAQSEPAAGNPGAVPASEAHAHPDLRLQQDDAPGPEGPGPRPE